ncbi:Aldehyde/histidinol dehydrogenase [Aspergillus undulatus]|uniref:Aldehyde/histidinol dehydrogenase n=1 Tax=Aspergillus undulatus TaxID=1810928 RepID=UPI003CCCE5D3
MTEHQEKHMQDPASAVPESLASDMGALSWNGHDDPKNPYNWPVSRQWALTCLAAFATFLTMMNGTIITVGHFDIAEQFNVSETAFPNTYWPVTTWASGGACSALFILPLTEDFGTRPVFLTTYFIFLCFLIPQAIAQNFATLVVTRFFAGGCAAILANTAAAVAGNVWNSEWSRSIPVSLYIVGYMAGSSMGPVMGAAIFQFLGWRWISYMQLIWFGALFPVYYFFFYESRGDVILARQARKERKGSGAEKKTSHSSTLSLQNLIVSSTRPMILFCTEPVLFVSTLWSAFTVGTLFLFTQSVEQVFMGLYGWTVTQTGYVQAAIVIGECIGWALCFVSRKLYFASASRNTETPGSPIPEARLYMAVLGGLFGISGGMFTYAWTSYSHIPWIALAISLAMVGVGSVLVVTGVSDYVVDAYSEYAGSAIGAVATGENIFSAFLPLATMSMYNNLRFQWASTLLAFISLVLSLVPTAMFVWGREVRVRSPFMTDPSLFIEKSYIDGQWVSSRSNKTFNVYNPATEELIGTAPESNTDDINAAIQAAANAFPTWRAQSGRQRGRILRKLFDLIVENKEDIGTIITAENGKATGDAQGEALFAASFFEWFSEEAPRIYGDVIPHSNPTSRTQVLKEPIGVAGLITPWNFPIAMGARKVAAALAAGCTVVMKSDGLTPFASNVLVVLAERAGVPKGVLNVVTALENTPALGLALCESDIVKKISFTGSTRVGKLLMQQSSSTLKKLSLELGGNAPFIVFDDADLETAVTAAIGSKFKLTGQTCVCANRFFVQEGIYDKFSKRLVEEVKKCQVGNGQNAGVTHGPLTNGVAKTQEHVQDAVSKKATVLLGGSSLPSVGKNFHELTILGDVDDSMKVASEETFGPLAALAKFKTEDEVVRRANSVEVGLASYLITSDLGKAHRVSERLEFGMVAINTGVISDSAAPFGGVKHSGMGREGSKYGIEDYVNIKMIVTGGINTVYSANL